MAYLLSSERSAATAVRPSYPFSGIVRWLAKVHSARARRIALSALIELEDHRLDDLGLCRQDLFEAIRNPDRGGRLLTGRRADRARSWHRSA